jgi:hypothetical protein
MKRGYMGSTEPQARKVLEEIEERNTRIKKSSETSDESTYRPQGSDRKVDPMYLKTKEEGDAELEELRRRQRERK